MGAVSLDIAVWRAQFPQFKSISAYPNDLIENYFAQSEGYISNWGRCNFRTLAFKRQALYLLTAHLAAIYVQINAGSSPNVMTGATIDKVSITVEPPPAPNAWQYWLQTTPYGQQLLALLQVTSAGGFYGGGYPTVAAFRR